MIVFYNICHLTFVNAFCIYKNVFYCSKLRRNFLKELAFELYKPLLIRNVGSIEVVKNRNMFQESQHKIGVSKRS